MLPEERRIFIRERLATQRTVTATELVKALGVAMATVRRDLAILEMEGALVRSHGGAVSKSSNTDFQPSYQVLQNTNRDEKKAIAAAAKSLIMDGEIVFLEDSTTVFELAGLLTRFAHLTVVTNSPPILSRLSQDSSMMLMSTGGELQKDLHYLCGAWTRDVLSQTRLDKAILGISAIDPAYGVSTTRPAHAEIKKLLTSVAKTRIGLVDHTKFGKQNFAYVGPITDFNTIVTSSLTPAAHIDALRSAGIEVIIAEL
jgi:DeoR family transcriptional regulator, fructose operon transcriptional repressor